MSNTNDIIDRILKSEHKKIMYLFVLHNHSDKISEIVELYCNGEPYDIQEIIKQYEISYSSCPDIRVANYQSQQSHNTPKCPTCQSTNLSKVSTLSKAGSVAMWGIFSQKIKKTFHCNNCGYEW